MRDFGMRGHVRALDWATCRPKKAASCRRTPKHTSLWTSLLPLRKRINHQPMMAVRQHLNYFVKEQPVCIAETGKSAHPCGPPLPIGFEKSSPLTPSLQFSIFNYHAVIFITRVK